ncbi:hypothetical protein K438DRAFT_1768789 [Mycena galopus ATCC 62051]|nr:hypothetical protein K438DRAFT_1768789 [Mycena galopus ATCC 62051]
MQAILAYKSQQHLNSAHGVGVGEVTFAHRMSRVRSVTVEGNPTGLLVSDLTWRDVGIDSRDIRALCVGRPGYIVSAVGDILWARCSRVMRRASELSGFSDRGHPRTWFGVRPNLAGCSIDGRDVRALCIGRPGCILPATGNILRCQTRYGGMSASAGATFARYALGVGGIGGHTVRAQGGRLVYESFDRNEVASIEGVLVETRCRAHAGTVQRLRRGSRGLGEGEGS